MKHLIVGTAGHVDHGKTMLIKYLTGTDTDRLIEEKKRGISIDIGFAVLRCDERITLGIVDVPGHERFLKNMLAGTGGIDLALLIIAADEGIMPQTREHFEMLQCFGVKKGIVVITKIDKVDAEWIELVEEEIKSFLANTFMASAPICKVSSISGIGMTELREVLTEQAKSMAERDRSAPFRLWIDRAFNLKGHGLIVTGSVLSGTINEGDTAVIQPSGSRVKIRELETHNQNAKTISAGQRASCKIGGIALGEAGRGLSLCAVGYGQKSKIWEGVVNWQNRFSTGTRVRLHIGTGEFIGRIAYADHSEAPESIVRLYLEEQLAAGLGDQGLLRRYSPQNVIGGIILLRPLERGTQKREMLAQLAVDIKKKDYTKVIYDLLVLAKEPLTMSEWVIRAGYVNSEMVTKGIALLLGDSKVRQAGNYYLTANQLQKLQTQLEDVLEEFHRKKPSESGISKEELRQRIHLPEQISDWFFQESAKQGQIEIREEFIASPVHAARHGDRKKQLLNELEQILPVRELFEITPEWIADKMHRPLKEMKPFFELLVREKIILRLSGVHVYRKTIQYIGLVLQEHFQSHATLSVSELRDLLNTSRRLVIPVLEYFDSHKYTVRKDDNRVPGPNFLNLSE